MSRYMWWHSLRKHRMRCDIDQYRMVTVCDCGHLWVCLSMASRRAIESREAS